MRQIDALVLQTVRHYFRWFGDRQQRRDLFFAILLVLRNLSAIFRHNLWGFDHCGDVQNNAGNGQTRIQSQRYSNGHYAHFGHLHPHSDLHYPRNNQSQRLSNDQIICGGGEDLSEDHQDESIDSSIDGHLLHQSLRHNRCDRLQLDILSVGDEDTDNSVKNIVGRLFFHLLLDHSILHVVCFHPLFGHFGDFNRWNQCKR